MPRPFQASRLYVSPTALIFMGTMPGWPKSLGVQTGRLLIDRRQITAFQLANNVHDSTPSRNDTERRSHELAIFTANHVHVVTILVMERNNDGDWEPRNQRELHEVLDALEQAVSA